MGIRSRPRWPYVAAAAAVIVGLLAIGAWRIETAKSLSSLSLPTAAQAAPVEAVVAALPTPPEASRDHYDSACGVPTPYCVTSETASARHLVEAVTALLVARGAHVEHGPCGDPDSVLGDCYVLLKLHGVGVALAAFERAEQDGFVRPARLNVVVATDEAAPEPAAEPLPAWATLALLPPAWGTVPCMQPQAGGCHEYKGTLRIAQPFSRVTATVRAAFQRWGLVVNHTRCRPAVTGESMCLFIGSKFRSTDGRDRVTVMASMVADAEAIRVLVMVTAGI